MNSVSRSLTCGIDPTRAPVAFGRSGSFDRFDLASHAAALAAAVARHGPGRWLLHSEDSYTAAVGLVALAQAECVAVMAPNRQPETLRRLSDGIRGAILDAESEPAAERDDPLSGVVRLDARTQPAAPHWKWREPDRFAEFAEFRTSGTTGDDKRIVKQLRHLEDEVETLERLFGARLSGCSLFATVSHQHIYGLLFRLLWPLAAGRPFQSDTFLHPQELLPRMLERECVALVSSPVHLDRINAAAELAELAPVCRAVFSSGAPLGADTAFALADTLGEAPFEILGSTETGGVAVRQRSADPERWTPFPGIDVAVDPSDERLRVTSPFASEGAPEISDGIERRRFAMGDRIELHRDSTFRLLGRADRIVKIGAKRLSLPAMERDLEAHPRVREAALLVLARGTEQRVHAVVALDEVGRGELRAGRRRALAADLGGHLAGRWDRVLLPRVWRYVAELPRDPQGKLPVARLRALFETQRRDPVVLEQRRDREHIERVLEVPDDLVYLDGHFDAFPVVAGVVQLRWVHDAVEDWRGERAQPVGVEALKFPEPLLPGQRLVLEVRGDRESLRFRLYDGPRIFATGRLRLGGQR